MKLQRRDLFRATVAGLLHKVLPTAAANAGVELAVAARKVGARLIKIRERVHQPFRDTVAMPAHQSHVTMAVRVYQEVQVHLRAREA